MGIVRELDRKSLVGLILSLLTVGLTLLAMPASAAPSGSSFDHIVIIAMENQDYSSVIGCSCAPFINSLAALGSTITQYHSYGAGAFSGDSIGGCSAACYTAFISGDTQGISDGYSCCLSGTTLVDQMQSAGLTWQAYCESGCPRGNDHFAFTGFSSDANSPNVFTSSSVSTSDFISAANSANPPNFLWYTPTDNHNMHDNSVSTGDSYIQQFLVGSGTVQSPASGSLFATNLFTNSAYHTMFYLWWDEYDPSPNVEYGPMIKAGFTSSASYDEYNSLYTIENNWNLPKLGNAAQASLISDIFGTIGSVGLSTSFSFSPSNPTTGTVVTFTGAATGGIGPYTYSWNYGDGSTGSGRTSTHTYSSAATFTATLTVTDSVSSTATATQSIAVSSTSSALSDSFTFTPSNPTTGTTVTFTGSASGGTGPYSYSWDYGDGSTGSGQTSTHAYSTASSFTATLTVTDSASNTATASHSIAVSSISSGSGQFDCVNWTCSNFVSPSTLSVDSNGTAEIRQSNPSVCDWANSYYDSLIRGAPPPIQGPSQGTPLPTGIASVTASVDLLSRDLGPSCSGPSGQGPRYNLFISLYFQLSTTVSACGVTNGVSYLDAQVRVEDVGGVDDPIGATTTYGGTNDPGVGACGYSLVVAQVGVGSTGTLIANAQAQCLQDEISWGISPVGSTSPSIGCTLIGVEIGTEGFDINSLSTNWYNVALVTGTPALSSTFTFTPTSPASGQSVSFLAVPVGGISPYSYSWTFGDGATGTGQSTSHTYASAGAYTVTLSVKDSASPQQTATSSQPVTVVTASSPDFVISASSPPVASVGGSSTSTVTLSASNGFSGTVSLSDTVPSGLVCGTISPSSLTGSGTATLSCGSSSAKVYSVTVKGTSGSLSHSVTVSFTFTIPPDFIITATSPSPVNVGSSAKSTITVTLLHGLVGPVALTESVPSGLNCASLSSTSFTANGTATVSCSSSSAATYSLTVTGTSGSLTHTTTAAFTFRDFTLTANPTGVSINTGSHGTSTISLNLLNGFGSTVALTVSSPTGVTAMLSTSSITGSGTSTLTISPTVIGSYSIVVTGTSGSLTRTVIVTVQVGTQVSPVLTAPSTETVGQTSTLAFTVTATESTIPTPTLTLYASQTPSGASFATVQGTAPVSSTFTWTPTTSTAPGTYTVSFTATDGMSATQVYVIIKVLPANVLPVITVPGPQNATVGGRLHFAVSANDPTGTGGPVILSTNALASNMAFDPASGDFSFTPSAGQAGQRFMINFTATDTNDPTWTTTESVPINVQGTAAQPSGGGLCLSCLLPRTITTTAWLIGIGALIGIVSAIAIMHLRATAELAATKRLVRSLDVRNPPQRVYRNNYRSPQTLRQIQRRHRAMDED